MNLRLVNEKFGKVKAYQFKADTPRLLEAFIAGLKEALGGSSSVSSLSVRGLIREATDIASKNKDILSICAAPLKYTPGNEKELLQVLQVYYSKLTKSEESKAEARLRKKRLDKAFNNGKRLLEQGKTSEADKAFQNALTEYRDENALFLMIAQLLCDANQHTRAITYVKKASEVFPAGDSKVKALQAAILKGRKEA